MRKEEEISSTNSCINKAKPGEMVFVLLGRDESAPVAIRAWASHRVSTGKNDALDAKIVEALECADTMEKERGKA